MASLLLGGYGVGIQERSPHHYGVSVASTVSLGDGIKLLSAPGADLIRDGAAGEAPADVAPCALVVGFFGYVATASRRGAPMSFSSRTTGRRR